MTGGLMQLVASGAQDLFLTGNPLISYFKIVYRRHTNFAIETIKQKFDTDVGFGARVSSTLSRNGDLITGAYIQATIPDLLEKQASNFALTANGLNNPGRRYTRWIDNLGHYLLKSVEISIGGNLIDKHYSDWLEIWAQLTVPAGKMVGYRKLIGQDPKNIFGQNTGLQADVVTSTTTNTQHNKIVGRDIFIPLQFWFCRNVGVALPLIALQYNDVRIVIEFQSPENLIQTWAGDVAQQSGIPIAWIGPENFNTYVSHNNMSASLWVDYVFLDADERRRFAQVSHEYLIEQIQINEDTCYSEQTNTIDLTFNHTVKELIWVMKGGEMMASKEWSNFTNTKLPLVPPFQTLAVSSNGDIITGLTGLPHETYINTNLLTISIQSNTNITGTVNAQNTVVFTVTPQVQGGYAMHNGDVITLNNTLLNDLNPDIENITLVVAYSINGIAISFLTTDAVIAGVNYNRVISIVRMGSTITPDKLSLTIRTQANLLPYGVVNAANGLLSISHTDDYSMMIGDIIQILPVNSNNTQDSRTLTVTEVLNGTATQFIAKEGLTGDVIYNRIPAIIRPPSGGLPPEDLVQVKIKYVTNKEINSIISVNDPTAFFFTFVFDTLYEMLEGDIVVVTPQANPPSTVTLAMEVNAVDANGIPVEFKLLNRLIANTVYEKIVLIERPADSLNGLSQITTQPTGLSAIKTYDDLMKFSNYNSVRPYSSINGTAGNPVSRAVLFVNNRERFMERPGSYFSLVQPCNHHTNIPESPGINIYSFALKPEDYQPSGTINFSRLDTAKLKVTTGSLYCDETQYPPGTPMKISVYAMNYNILRIVNGMGGLAYN